MTGFARLILPLLLAIPTSLFAQETPLPDRRMIFEQNVDYYGGDLRAIFETDINFCERTCLSETECQAFTFNTGASACFLKTDIQSRNPYDGAKSARIADTAPAYLERSTARAAALTMLSGTQMSIAKNYTQKLARLYPDIGNSVDELLEIAQSNESSNPSGGMHAAARATAIEDSASAWGEFARLAVLSKGTDSRTRRTYNDNALYGAINAYLRAGSAPEQATMAFILGQALEKNNRGRASIDAFRISMEASPRDDTDKALDRAIRLFGFRIVDTHVESDALSPRICMTFSEELVETGIEYATYVNIEGDDLPVEINDRDLCIEGVEHGARVSFTLREGLPALSGETLLKSIDQSHYVRDRSPSVRFLGRAYVLPRSEDAAIPVVSVNATEVELHIYRMVDRNLMQGLQEEMIGNPLQYYDKSRLQNRLGEKVWDGVGDVGNELNTDLTTALPIGDAISSFEPGVYAMTAQIPGVDLDGAPATQWFIVTDLGLASMMGNDGLHVLVRGLSDALPRAGVTAELIAKNNDVLGVATTDARGYAIFPAGLTRGENSNAPGLVTVRDGDEDFAFLDLTEAGFDLSDRGVEGRSSPPPIDVFLSTERGAYRPGETVFATILARDNSVAAIPTLPLTVVISRPDGVEFNRTSLPDQGAGGRAHSIVLPDTAQRGTWRMRVYADPKASALSTVSFLVEDFVPERIDFTLDLPEGNVDVADTVFMKVSARYLYGAPGVDLSIEGETRLRPVSELEGYKGYRFGPHDAKTSVRYKGLNGDQDLTDENGAATVTLEFPVLENAEQPWEMTAFLRLKDSSGRPVERTITRPVAPFGTMIGLKPLFDGTVPEDASAQFNILAIGPSGPVALENVKWEISRVRRRYQWYELDGRWRYEPYIRRERIADGTVNLGLDEPTLVEAPVEWGEYELTVTSLEGGYTHASRRFYVGWYAVSSGTDTPDQLQVALDKEAYAIGDIAKVQVEARSAGQVVVSVVNDGLVDMKMLAVEAGATEIDIEVTDKWGPGAYVIATHISPLDARAGRNPTRAMGLSWVAVDPGAAKLDVSFTSSDFTKPRQALVAELQVDGITPGSKVYATVAAVDVGILNLTGFKSPAPVDHYLGQRALGMEMRDLYGRLIDGLQGARGAVRSGGDDTGGGSKSTPPTQDLVAFFSGAIEADADGKITASFDIPDFNGTVRLMAVVWSDEGVGNAVQDVIVRDPVVVTASLPRFMAPGDTSRLLLELTNVEAGDGQIEIVVEGRGAVPVAYNQNLTLNEGDRTSISVPISASEVSDSGLQIRVTTPAGDVLTKDLRLAIRANDPPISRQSRFTLDGNNGELVLDDTIFTGLVPGSADAVLSAGPLALFDAPGLLAALDAYPYGCTEQTTSRALALVYFNEVAAKLGGAQRANINERIAFGIDRVLANQSRSGSFGLWSSFRDGDLWLDAYVTDFLSRAREKGHEVPDLAFTQALDNLQNRVNYAGDFEDGGEGVAYALYTLAREGRASMGDLRYYADARADAFGTPLAKAQLGAALAAYGDTRRADRMMRLAVSHLRERQREAFDWRNDFGSYMRDEAAILTLAVEAGSDAVDRDDMTTRIVNSSRSKRYMSTQEQLWMLMAARSLTADATAGDLVFNGAPVTGPMVEALTDRSLASSPVTLLNTGEDSVDVVLSVYGIPTTPEPAQGNGYSITRDYFSIDGEPVAVDSVPLNTRLVTVLTVTPERKSRARLMVTDPLPAGFEIDNPKLVQGGDINALRWLDLKNVARYTEFGTDRFSAAVTQSGTKSFTLAYIVRAISPGNFRHPAASVEDMYRPAYRARTDTGEITITEAE